MLHELMRIYSPLGTRILPKKNHFFSFYSGEKIVGEVYQVDTEMLAFLDDFEGHPMAYIRKEILVEPLERNDEISTLPRKCWCYFYNVNATKDHEVLQGATFLSDYDSKGDHGTPYIFQEDDDRLEFLR